VHVGVGSSPLIVDCVFIENTAGLGGVIFCTENASLTLEECSFRNNAANGGGAILSKPGSQVDIAECYFQGNSAEPVLDIIRPGGAINCGGSMTISHSSFLANKANLSKGGAIYGALADILMTNCTLASNSADLGGGIYLLNTDAALDNVIIAFCTLGEAIGSNASLPEDPVLSCCDVFGNAGGDWVGCIAGQDSVRNNMEEDPLFCSAGSTAPHPLMLQSDSPCAPGASVCGQVGAFGVGCGPSTKNSLLRNRPETRLAQNVPNPFNPLTTIVFSLQKTCPVRLEVFDLRGRMIRLLVEGNRPSGRHEVSWRGDNSHGERVPSGVYFYRLVTPGYFETRRMILLK